MNPETLLALIADLYSQLRQLTAENQDLRATLNEIRQNQAAGVGAVSD